MHDKLSFQLITKTQLKKFLKTHQHDKSHQVSKQKQYINFTQKKVPEIETRQKTGIQAKI